MQAERRGRPARLAGWVVAGYGDHDATGHGPYLEVLAVRGTGREARRSARLLEQRPAFAGPGGWVRVLPVPSTATTNTC